MGRSDSAFYVKSETEGRGKVYEQTGKTGTKARIGIVASGRRERGRGKKGAHKASLSGNINFNIAQFPNLAESESLETFQSTSGTKLFPGSKWEKKLTSLRRFDDLGVGEVEDVDVVDGEDDVADLEAARLGRRVGLDGRHDDGPRAVDAEAELAAHARHFHGFIAF